MLKKPWAGNQFPYLTEITILNWHQCRYSKTDIKASVIHLFKVGFFGGICIPCYDLLSKVMPTITPMLEQCHSNWGKWKKLAEERKLEKEKAEQARKEKEEAEKKE